VRAAHILIEFEGYWPPSRRKVERTRSEAYQMAVELRLRARSGESFADLARVHSDCPSAEDGGDLGHFLPGDMEPEFEAAVRETPIGAVGQVTRTKFGWHVIKRLD
jgi:peptidyl-prolyl cis-trans isomerase C/peptidyl-prolyl cis-trans isomerase SurA